MTDAQRKVRALDAANREIAERLLADPAIPAESIQARWAEALLKRVGSDAHATEQKRSQNNTSPINVSAFQKHRSHFGATFMDSEYHSAAPYPKSTRCRIAS